MTAVSSFGHATSAANSVAETVVLTGTVAVPNLSQDSEVDANALVWWQFYTSGEVWRIVGNIGQQWNDGVEWNRDQPSPSGNYWIRATLESGGDAPTSGPSLNTWHKVLGSGAVNRQWQWVTTGPGEEVVGGTLKIEISDDASGSPILATGYYRGLATRIAGAPK